MGVSVSQVHNNILNPIVAILKFLSHLVFEFNAPIVRKDKSSFERTKVVSHDRQICVVSIFACRRILQCIRDTEIKGNNSKIIRIKQIITCLFPG